ncbi:MAG: hypothetical protein KDA84_23560 [Planctomycetaceae bacterium]|nr:hypothetical protein [Planctomycetaceae bacterium]
MKHVGFFLIVVSAFVGSPATRAAGSPVKSATLERVGFDGRFKVGQWTPFVVRVETDGPCQAELQVEVADDDGNRTVWTEDFALDSAGTHRLAMLFQAGRLNVNFRPRVVATTGSGDDQQWTIPVTAGEGPFAQLSQKALTHEVLLVGTFGKPGGMPGDPDSLGKTVSEKTGENRIPTYVTPIQHPNEFTVVDNLDPGTAFTNATSLEALDVLVISGQYDFSESQSQSIKTWVTLGGHLILSVGSEWEDYQASPLADWISNEPASGGTPRPFRITGTRTFLRLDNLESYAGGNPEPIEINRQNPVVAVKIEHEQNVEAKVPLSDGSLIAKSAYGMGTITLVGVSLSEDPVRSWSSLPQVVAKLLQEGERSGDSRSKSTNNQLAYTGIGEFATQLHTAVVMYPAVNRLSTWTIIAMMAAYLLVIGPLDYVLVHHVLGKPRLTWFTLPVLVVLVSAFCIWVARSQNGTDLITNQVDVLDYDVSTRTLRSRSWASIYSPETRRYQVSLEANPLSQSANAKTPTVRMSWFGVPETSFGGMYREGGQQILPPQYRFAPGAKRIDNLPVPIWGAKAFTGEWFEQGTVWVESELESQRPGQLKGNIRHNFPVPITDWFIAFDNWVFLPRTNLITGEPDALPPNVTWPPNPESWSTNQRDLEGFLTQSVAKEFEQQDGVLKPTKSIRMEKAPYDPLAKGNPDPLGNIVRILSFYGKVGGKQYTGLDNYSFRKMDLSSRLQQQQAVLYGRLDISPTQLNVADHEIKKDRQTTVIRIVLPVKVTRQEESFFSDRLE